MAGRQPDDLRAHIESISARSERDLERLADVLSGHSWPGGAHDRSEPGALSWLRRWRPRGPVPPAPACECPSGRCLVCN
jgi:hypothetical protein